MIDKLKNRLIRLITVVGAIFILYELVDRVYYKTFNGNDEIIFIDFKGSHHKDYLELFKLPELKDKYVFTALNLRGDWDEYRNDLIAMNDLVERYKDTNLVFLYTVDSIGKYNDKYNWKKTIKNYNLRGYHINLPYGYENNLWESKYNGNVTYTIVPKYMLISDEGNIITKQTPMPSKFNELTNMIDSVLKLNDPTVLN